MNGRKKIALALMALGVVWGTYAAWDSHVENVQAAHREAMYQAALASAKRDIPLGTSRSDLTAFATERRLEFTQGPFSGDRTTDFLVTLGKEPSPRWFCSYEGVYLDFKFQQVPTEADRDATGPLQSISILHWMRDCL